METFASLAAFLRDLQAEAASRGLAVQKVIIAPEYVPLLLATPSGRQLGKLAVVLSRGPAWVRHDEHFHVDFAVPGSATPWGGPSNAVLLARRPSRFGASLAGFADAAAPSGGPGPDRIARRLPATQAGPMSPRRKATTIDLSDLASALEDHSGMDWYLDTRTGDVLPVPEDADDDLLPVPHEELVESDRFILIEPLDSRFGWEEMRDFVEHVEDSRLRELLEVALAGKGAFGRFKGVLADHPEERARWFAEHDRHMEEQARHWLDREGIAWAARDVGGRKGSVAGAPGGQGAAQQAPSPGGSRRPAGTKCELCSGEDRYSHWIEVVPEGEGISRVTVDVTLGLCPDHRARLLQAVNREDSGRIEPPRESKPWGSPR